MKLPTHVGAAALDVEVRPGGVVIVSVPQLPGLGYGSSEPIAAFCTRCRRPTAPVVSVALTSLYQRVATRPTTLYGSITICATCAKD